MLEKSIENITTPDNTFASNLNNSYLLVDVKFGGNSFKNNNISSFRKGGINLYITYN